MFPYSSSLSLLIVLIYLHTLLFLIFKKNTHLYRKEDLKEADSEKEAAMEAELRAARERAIVPLEARMTQFKDMLLERGVSTKSNISSSQTRHFK